MRIRKLLRPGPASSRDLIAHQKAILATTISDERSNAWALEMLGAAMRLPAGGGSLAVPFAT
jgi:hypothetical protein